MSKNDGMPLDPCYVFYDAVRNTPRLTDEDKEWLLGLFYSVDCKVRSLQAQNQSLSNKLRNKKGMMFPEYEISALRHSAELLSLIADASECLKKEGEIDV